MGLFWNVKNLARSTFLHFTLKKNFQIPKYLSQQILTKTKSRIWTKQTLRGKKNLKTLRDKYWKTHSFIISENFTIIFTFRCKFHVRDKLQNHCQNRKINFLFGKPTPLISYAEQFKSSNLIEFHWKVKKERLIWPTIKLKCQVLWQLLPCNMKNLQVTDFFSLPHLRLNLCSVET